jgi:hypothetical protein
MKKHVTSGPWTLEYTLDDGARIDRLAHKGYDLLTTAPRKFQKPVADYGAYELRPVYGYDDCFPSVERCRFPGLDWEVPDHGEVCWLQWQESEFVNGVTFSVCSKVLPLKLTRRVTFYESAVIWDFEVQNEGDKPLPFQHVMHPLMPLSEIQGFTMPVPRLVLDRSSKHPCEIGGPDGVSSLLMKKPAGTATMLFLVGVNEGKMSWTYKNGLRVNAEFPVDLFPSIGIWWNNVGYPDESGIRRDECAFEPVPGNSSALTEAHRDGLCLNVQPKQRFSWKIRWDVRENS